MQIAKVSDNTVVQVADDQVLFPNTSFAGGPNASFLDENGCLPVLAWLEHDPATHRLAPVDPYIAADVVLTVAVVELTQAEIDAAAAEALDALKAQRAEAYRAESDPLFFKWQAGEGTQEAWLTKREEIRTRFLG